MKSQIKLIKIIATRIQVHFLQPIPRPFPHILWLIFRGLLYLLFYLRSRDNLFLLPILAPLTLTTLRTAHSRVEALAVPLQTVRFLAITSLLRQTTVADASFFYTGLSGVDVLLKFVIVFAGYAGTVLSTFLGGGEAFAVHLEAESFLAGAAYLLLLGRIIGSLCVGALLCEGILLGLLLGGVIREVEVFVGMGWEGVDGVDHFEGVVYFGHVVHGGEQIKWGLHLLAHRGSWRPSIIIKLINFKSYTHFSKKIDPKRVYFIVRNVESIGR